MLELNLPPFGCKIKKKDARLYIWDVIRRKYVALTPEEWVRQHFIHFLISFKAIPHTLISLEQGHGYHGLQKRTDILVWNRQMKPFLLVECKAAHVPLGEEALFQVGTYNTQFHAPYLAVTNGMAHYFFRRTGEGYERMNELPEMG